MTSATGLLTQHCTAYGVSFSLAAEEPEVLTSLLQALPCHTTFLTAHHESEPVYAVLRSATGYSLRVNGVVVDELSNVPETVELLSQELMIHVANMAVDRVFIHAGVVGWRGGAIVMPGTSFAGKTTLVAALVRAGAVYYSDEYAVLDAQGRVFPYPRALQMRQPGRPEQVALSVEALGGYAGSQPLPVFHVVFCQYRPGAQWDPQRVSGGRAVLEILRHAIPVQRTPGRVMAALSAMMRTAQAIYSARSEADKTAAALLSSIEDLLQEQTMQGACA